MKEVICGKPLAEYKPLMKSAIFYIYFSYIRHMSLPPFYFFSFMFIHLTAPF